MALIIQIAVDKDYDPEKVKMFWTPFKLKFKDRPKFKFEEYHFGKPAHVVNAVRIPWYLVPTYRGMLHLENLESKRDNQLVVFAEDNEYGLLCYDIRDYK